MERVGALIHKLKDQYDQNVDKKNLLVTVQLLLAELEQESAENMKKGNVSVVLPKVHRIVQDIPGIETPLKDEPSVVTTITHVEQPAENKTSDRPELPETIRSYILKPPQQPEIPKSVAEEPKNLVVEPVQEKHVLMTREPAAEPQKNKPEPQQSLFDPVAEVPTLLHQKEVYELNDVHIDSNSLNDKLKEERTELAATIKGDTVQDLRKAIGINDRYRFINELFRGDEPMYDRSIKTINGFDALPEASSWIERELKVKLGWNEKSTTVKDFDQVVKRRFS